jgi:hypothetical protein
VSILSVDLGTSNTVAVLAAHGRAPRVVEVDGAAAMPSAVFAADDGHLVVGREAERRARLDPARFEPNPKRRIDDGQLLLGDRVVTVTDAFAAVLGKVGAETVRQLGGARPDEVRLTHPAQWGPVRRNVLLSAARQASLGAEIVLVPEPVAAAAHFASFPGRSLGAGQALAVYDLGAGTFDVAVVGAASAGFTVLAESGLPDLGGLDVDQALLAHVGTQVSHHDPQGWQRLLRPESTADRRAARTLREDVRAAKEALSGHPQTDLPLPEPFPDVLVTRMELEGLIRPNLLRSVELLASTVQSAGVPSLAGVYLVGGSSRIPLVAQLIGEQLRLLPTNLDQPETAVALGAHHIAREGMSLRTEDLPPAVAAEERTVAIASPPRPQPSRPQPPRSSVGPPPGPMPPHSQVPPTAPPLRTAPGPAPLQVPSSAPEATAAKRTKVRRRVLIGVLVAIVGLVVVNAVVGLVVWLNEPPRRDDSNSRPSTSASATSETGRPEGITLARPKEVSDSARCRDMVTASDIQSVSGMRAKAVTPDEPSEYCVFELSTSKGEYYATVGVDFEARNASSFSDSERIGLTENTTFEYENSGNECTVATALREAETENGSGAMFYIANALGPQACELARSVVSAEFDNLPDA